MAAILWRREPGPNGGPGIADAFSQVQGGNTCLAGPGPYLTRRGWAFWIQPSTMKPGGKRCLLKRKLVCCQDMEIDASQPKTLVRFHCQSPKIGAHFLDTPYAACICSCTFTRIYYMHSRCSIHTCWVYKWIKTPAEAHTLQ